VTRVVVSGIDVRSIRLELLTERMLTFFPYPCLLGLELARSQLGSLLPARRKSSGATHARPFVAEVCITTSEATYHPKIRPAALKRFILANLPNELWVCFDLAPLILV
jgi:hypothetical protein